VKVAGRHIGVVARTIRQIGRALPMLYYCCIRPTHLQGDYIWK
jgi:hypothetical protein